MCVCVCVCVCVAVALSASHSLSAAQFMPAVYAWREFQHGEPQCAQNLIISSILSTFLASVAPWTFAVIVVVNDVAEEDVVRVCDVDVFLQ